MRRDGKIPAVVYGAGKDSLPISVDPRVVTRILNSETGHNTIFDLALNGEKAKAMIVDWQYEPIKGRLLHIDLKRIALDKVLRVSVPIFLAGEAAGVKQEGGILEQMLREGFFHETSHRQSGSVGCGNNGLPDCGASDERRGFLHFVGYCSARRCA